MLLKKHFPEYLNRKKTYLNGTQRISFYQVCKLRLTLSLYQFNSGSKSKVLKKKKSLFAIYFACSFLIFVFDLSLWLSVFSTKEMLPQKGSQPLNNSIKTCLQYA